MGEEMLRAIGYAYVRETQKVLGNAASGAGRLEGMFEGVLQGAHDLTEGVAAVGRWVHATHVDEPFWPGAHRKCVICNSVSQCSE